MSTDKHIKNSEGMLKHGNVRPDTHEADQFNAAYDMNHIGNLIREARHAKGLSKQELASLVGMHDTYIDDVEHGRVEAHISTLHKIVDVGLNGRLEFTIKLK